MYDAIREENYLVVAGYIYTLFLIAQTQTKMVTLKREGSQVEIKIEDNG